MQVNKRAGEDIDQQDPKKYKTKESSVAEAALKYDNNSGKAQEKETDGEDHDSHNIDSELLSHQSASFEQGEEGAGQQNDNAAENASESNENAAKNAQEDAEHAQLSEQLTSYNALRHPSQEESTPQEQQHHEQATHTQQSPTASSHQSTPSQPTTQILHQSSEKPLAGTEEWHRIRKDNHKEVERRRRENINTGIKELASLLPTQDSNKSQILQRAIEYIKRLKENENNNIEKWTLEKLLTDQAVAELTASNEKLKAELERAYREVEHWKKVSVGKK